MLEAAKSQTKRPITGLWNRQKVMDVTDLSKSVLYDLMKRGLFPLPVQTGKRNVSWVDSEVLDWVVEQAQNGKRAGKGRIAVPNTPWSRRSTPASADGDMQQP